MYDQAGADVALPEADDDIDPRCVVPGLSRGLALPRQFDRRQPARTLAKLTEGPGINRSATFRLVDTLEKGGFIARDAALPAFPARA